MTYMASFDSCRCTPQGNWFARLNTMQGQQCLVCLLRWLDTPSGYLQLHMPWTSLFRLIAAQGTTMGRDDEME